MKKFEKYRQHINKELYNAARYKVHKLNFNKEKDYFKKKNFSSEVSALKVNKTFQHSTNLVLAGFKD